MRTKKRSVVAILAVLVLLALVTAMLITGCGSDDGNKESTQTTEDSAGEESNANEPVEIDPGEMSSTPETTGPTKSEQALEQAKAEGKPVLLNFHGEGCAPCVQMEKNMAQVEPEYEGKVAFVIVEAFDRSESNLCTEYGLETIPTTFFLKGDGTVQNGFVGILSPDQMKEQMDALLAN